MKLLHGARETVFRRRSIWEVIFIEEFHWTIFILQEREDRPEPGAHRGRVHLQVPEDLLGQKGLPGQKDLREPADLQEQEGLLVSGLKSYSLKQKCCHFDDIFSLAALETVKYNAYCY